jgi:antitoxin component YwqK of YwqJK toxin-antitoxin module
MLTRKIDLSKQPISQRIYREADGRIWKIASYRDLVLEGECKIWHENGLLFEHSFYQRGQMHGERRVWGLSYMIHEFYSNGIGVGEYKYWKDGLISTHWLFNNGKIFDFRFSMRKKFIILRARKRLLFRYKISHVISDLSNIIYGY